MFRLLTPAVLTVLTMGMTAQAQPGPFRILPGNSYRAPLPAPIQNGFRVNFGGNRDHDDHYHVQFRQMNWQTQDFDCPIEARRFENYKQSQGFEVTCRHHGDHVHVSFRRPNWTTYRTVNSDPYAHQLERWLESQGYDARVVHH